MPRPSHLSLPAAALLAVAIVLVSVRDHGAPPLPATHDAFGASGTPIVLVHGLGSRSSDWLPVARRLARHHRVVLVELPGHGETALPDPLTLDAAAGSIDLGLAPAGDTPVILVGHSIGGLVAAAVAVRDPARVCGLVLVEAALSPQLDSAGCATVCRQLDRGYDALLRSAYGAFGRDSVQGATLYAEAATCDSVAMKRWIRLAVSEDFSQRAAAIRCPVLAILAERTWPRDESWAAEARELGLDRIARLEPVRLAGCGHFVMLDRPADVAAAIERFARSLDTTGPLALANAR